MKPRLNTDIIYAWLEKNERPVAWLARQIGVDRMAMYQRMVSRSTKDIDKIAEIIGVHPIDLIEI